jgi:hypothetical protein
VKEEGEGRGRERRTRRGSRSLILLRGEIVRRGTFTYGRLTELLGGERVRRGKGIVLINFERLNRGGLTQLRVGRGERS